MNEKKWFLVETLQADPGEAQDLLTKWRFVAEDMALLPELNIRIIEENGRVLVKVSQELFDCMSGL